MKTKLNILCLCIGALFSFNASAQNYTITSVAGTGNPGYSGDAGAATAAELYSPNDVAIDPSGNLYIADFENNRVRKVNTIGIITTFAGDGIQGYSGDGFPATLAELNGPLGVASDTAGNIYIADSYNYAIRKVDKNGTITTVAGTGIPGYSGDGSAATSAKLAWPTNVAVDRSGNIYIADYVNDRVRVVNISGVITTYAGNGTNGYSGDGGVATMAELNGPYGVAVDTSGNVYVGDFGNDCIRKINTTDTITTIAGNGTSGYSGDGGPATAAQLTGPEGLKVDDSGNVYIAEYGGFRVRKVYTNQVINTITGNGVPAFSGDCGPATAAELYGPTGIALDAFGNVYISDFLDNHIRELFSSVSITPGSPSVCKGQKLTLKVSGGTGTTYQWVGTSNTTDTITVTPKNDTAYELRYTTGACLKDTFISVLIGGSSSLIIQPQSPRVCSGQSVTLTVPTSGTNYMWSPQSGLSATTGDTVVANPTQNSTYTVTGTDSLGCTASASDTITIVPAPNVPSITVSVTGDSLISSATSDNQWNFDDSPISGATDSFYVIKGHAKGWYTVTVTNEANGCSTTSDSTTSIEQLSVISNQLSVFPNPNNGSFIIQLQNASQNTLVKVYNVLGENIFETNLNSVTTQLNLNNQPAGIYLYRVLAKDGQFISSGKVVVE